MKEKSRQCKQEQKGCHAWQQPILKELSLIKTQQQYFVPDGGPIGSS